MVEYTIDDIRGPTVAREMAQLKEFVLEKFNGAIADAEAAAAAAAQAVLDSLDTRVGVLEGDMTTVQGAVVTLDGAVVKLAGTQTITGAKTFSLSPTVPAPTNATDAATKKYVDDADALKLNITDVNNYAVGLTGIQNVSGTKMFTNGFFESMKASGIIAFEIFRYPINGEMNIFMEIFSRFGCISGSLKIETSGGAITNMTLTKTVLVSSGLGIFTLYAYIDDSDIVVCVGNRITANSNYCVHILGGCDGAGNSLVPDISNIKTARNVSTATKVDVF